jgi:hypothetical protein
LQLNYGSFGKVKSCLKKHLNKKSVSRSPSAETRWRACEEAFAAAAGPKRREALATGARQKKSVSRSPSVETRWRACEEAFAAAAGPKRREALATGARHQKPDARFYTFLSYNTRPLPVLGDGLFLTKKRLFRKKPRTNGSVLHIRFELCDNRVQQFLAFEYRKLKNFFSMLQLPHLHSLLQQNK